jgi:hypothetical protein
MKAIKRLVMMGVLFTTGCVAGGEPDAGFSIAWSLVDSDGQTVTCEMADAGIQPSRRYNRCRRRPRLPGEFGELMGTELKA